MIQDYFAGITPAAAAGFVGLLSLANMAGRIGWSSTSDYVGRKPTYVMYLGVGAVLYFVLASFGATSLVLFLLVTVAILSFYGGGFATVPAYLKDMFGVAEVGAIKGEVADGVVGRWHRGTTHHQRHRRLPDGRRTHRSGPLHPLAIHHGRCSGRWLHRQLAGPAGGSEVPHGVRAGR